MASGFTGRITKTVTVHKKTGKNDVTLTDEFSYDAVGRLLTHDQTLTQGTTTVTQTVAAHCYDDLGQLARKSLGSKLQTLDYAYNMRGWMTTINNTQDLGSDLFAFSLGYLPNGNISGTSWKNSENTALQSYTYSYDGLSRILSATSGDSNYNVSGITYDLNGNIKTLQRGGYTGGESFGSIDNLDYTYYDNTNRLKSVSDGADTAYGFKAANATYTYDANGNMITDTGKGVNSITYNHLNLSTTVTSSQGTLNYTYDASGVKLQKTVGSDVTQYAGSFLYKNGTLEMIHTPEGYMEHDNGVFKYVYRITDHLGNTRVSFKDSDEDGSIDADNEVVETNDFYPFGLQHQKANQVVGGNLGQKFKYQTQELEDNLDYNMYEFELRHYDAAIGRFVATDPYEQFESPYVAMGNNPVVSIDPDGGYCYDVNGNQISCPDGAGDFYNDYVDNEENHITIFDEVEVTQGEEEPINVRPEFKSINKLVGWEHTKAEIDLNIKGHRTEAANGGYYMVDASGNIIKGPIVGGAGLLEFINGGATKVAKILGQLRALKFRNQIKAKNLKELKSLIIKLSKPTTRDLTQRELNKLEKLVEKFGGRVRRDLNPVKKANGRLDPHVQIEGFGTSIKSRHIFIKAGVQ